MPNNIEERFGLCPDCSQPKTGEYWCQNCNSKRFQKDFDKWTSGNELIDKFIQDAQLNARDDWEVVEWIPYHEIFALGYIGKGGFSTVYSAYWRSGFIKNWDNEKNEWRRCQRDVIRTHSTTYLSGGWPVILKSLDNSSNINENLLNEWKNHLHFVHSTRNNGSLSVQLYGITQNPKTLNYVFVLQKMKLGNLRSNLMIKKYNPNDKYANLYNAAKSLSALHNECNLVHGDLHSGNLLLNNDFATYISDLGLSRPAGIKSNEIYGVLPYIAPEVLRGKPYTKAADIYSFGIIMWEMTSGIPAFNDIPHDFDLSLRVCRGLRPRIVEDTEPEYVKLMKECWNSDPDKRPTAKDLTSRFKDWHNIYDKKDKKKRIPVPEEDPTTQNHPSSFYTSRKFDFSAKLNEVLGLSSRVIVNKDDNYDEKILSEDLEDCRI